MTIVSVLILSSTALLAALSIAGGLWNLIDALAFVLHRAAIRGRARSAVMQLRLERRWVENVGSGNVDMGYTVGAAVPSRTMSSINYNPAPVCSSRLD